MRIIALSDLHGFLPEIKDFGDVVCICGDIVPLNIQVSIPKCEKWLKEKFIPWANNLQCKKVILIAGNHDFFFERVIPQIIKSIFEGSKVEYLDNSSFEFEGTKFYGTPYCKQFGNWAFMESDESLSEIFKGIPENVDVLLTHDAPFGISDVCQEEVVWNNFQHIGNKPLREAVENKSPKLMLHGHLHSSNHELEYLGETQVYNVSLLNEKYKLTYDPLVINI